MRRTLLVYFCSIVLLFSGCIKNDLPYPYIEGLITDIHIEGQVGTPVISKDKRTVSLIVNDSVSLHSIRIQRLLITDNASLTLDDASSCMNASAFPVCGFVSLDYLSADADTRIDATKPFHLTVQTYQSYSWTILVEQNMNRRVSVNNQVGEAIIDAYNHTVNIDVSTEQNLSDIQINELKLGLAGARITPDPSQVKDFNYPQIFQVFNEPDSPERWVVSIFQTNSVVTTKSASAWAKKAYLSAEMKVGTGLKPTFLYRKASDAVFTEVPASDITVSGASFTGVIQNLTPETKYIYKAVLGDNQGSESSFITEAMEQVPNLSFEDWYKNKITWYPDADLSDANYFWDTGNKGTNTLSEKNPTSPEYTDVVKGTACRMASTKVLNIFAAGSIVAGKFVKVDGIGAEMSFGRPYTCRPTSLKGYYKYNSGIIDMTKEPYNHLKGVHDTCHIYIALFDKGEPYRVNTKENLFVDFTSGNPNLIAYGELKDGSSSSTYKEFDIPLHYYKLNASPTHIVIVASSSKFGDYFTGSTSSVLLLDELELSF